MMMCVPPSQVDTDLVRKPPPDHDHDHDDDDGDDHDDNVAEQDNGDVATPSLDCLTAWILSLCL